MQIFAIHLFNASSLLFICNTLYILFVFLEKKKQSVLFLSALSSIPVLFCLFLLSKDPRKAVLFHEYQVSTGRINKLASLFAACPVSLMSSVSMFGFFVLFYFYSCLLDPQPSLFCQRLRKTNHYLCVRAMGADLQLTWHNNYM